MDREQITEIIHSVTGAPTSGLVADITPALVDALDAALNPPATEVDGRTKRVLEVDETR